MNKYKNTQEMRLKLQKSNEPFLYQKVGRFFSIYITKFCLRTNITANQISVLFCICSVISAVFIYLTISTQNVVYFFLSIFFLYLFIILDGVDGEIARDRQTANPITGKVIDVLCHDIFDNSAIIAITLGIYSRDKSHWPVLICLFLYFGRNVTRRLEDIIIRTVRLHGHKQAASKKNTGDKIEKKQKKEPAQESKSLIDQLKYLASAIPFKGLHFVGILALFGDEKLLLAIFALWAINFNIKWVKNSIKFFRNPLGYLPD